MRNLGEAHKQTLRFLVKSIRDDVIPAEFTVFWENGAGYLMLEPRRQLFIPHATRLGLDLLEREGLILSSKNIKTAASGRTSPSNHHSQTQREFEIARECVILDAGRRAVDSDFAPVEGLTLTQVPPEITTSLQKFRADYPDNTKLAFVIMRFATTTAHAEIYAAIQNSLRPHNIIALRADEKQYHGDLLHNILTYIYGCRFGIAAFERIQTNDFNPNISLEVGYMMGLGKSVCLLKDQTLPTLHSDLAGRLYHPFDTQDADGTLKPTLLKWMRDWGFIPPS